MAMINCDDTEVFFFKKGCVLEHDTGQSNVELLFCLSGEITINISDTQFLTVREKELFIIPSYIKHLATTVNGAEFFILNINIKRIYRMFSGSPYLSHIEQFMGIINQGVVIQGNRTDNIFTLASLITNEYSLVNFSKVIEVIDKINQVKDDDIYVLNLSEAVLKEYRFISSIDSYIEENPCMDNRIEHLSKMFNMSRSTFIRLFSKHSNMPFHQWVIRKKIAIACYNLIYTNDPIQNISDYLGFSSSSHFSREFYKYKHISPLAYRKSSRTEVSDIYKSIA